MVIAPLNHEYGLGYLIAAVILGGLIQIALGALGVAKLMRFVPRSVMVGFVNALAILIFMAQVPEMRGVPWAVYPPIIGGLAFMVFFPKITTVIPAPLVSIVILAVITVPAGTAVPNVGDKGELPSSLPVPGLLLEGTLDAEDRRDSLGHPAAAPLRAAWSEYGPAIGTKRGLRDWLALDFFKDVHKGMHEWTSSPIFLGS